ncbi:hypothetical protein CC85DRAFT_47603 [Cutaneotrichosporon oleaginosum]|uniref:Uncharacterized protein n=1 Tax=Cutaneotrichosporon oleaginosum TaxID=879819 RepID=A0A0J0XQX2_9TREE|nr:uncharacterized protein CC85DRAFT_47603 [Cutaneotrichosporon oleaginosum]KLT43482.1 hypothetical protein CC85DRAFT_47603 [Cutaneotrichosporon oleaginosum]TXT05615.1 hypothetical protein COLE_06935 [Cutaneotrichosporon oleaginosum]
MLLVEDLGTLEDNLGYLWDNSLISPSSYATSFPALIRAFHDAGAATDDSSPEIYFIYPRGNGLCYGMLPPMMFDDPDKHEVFKRQTVYEERWVNKWLTFG